MVFFDLIVYLYVYEIKTRRHSKMLTAPKFKKKSKVVLIYQVL